MISFNEIKVLTEDFRNEIDGVVFPKMKSEEITAQKEVKLESNHGSNVLNLTKKYIDRCFQKAKERGEAWANFNF